MGNDLKPERESSNSIVEKDGTVIVGRLKVDGNGNETEIWIHDDYKTYEEAIQKDMRDFARKQGMLKS
jgi:hypothetical protein